MRICLRLLAALALSVLPMHAQSSAPEPQNLPTALQPLYQSALKGDPEAAFDLAMRYSAGGVEVRRNLALCAKWLRKAADLGHTRAMLTLAEFCRDSRYGTPNLAESFRWIHLAAQKSDVAPDKADPEAYLQLGNAYFEGEGIAKNPTEGLKLLHKSAALSHPAAFASLASRYETGTGVAVDYVESRKWYLLADLAGAPVRQRLDLVTARIQTPEAEKAQAAADQYIREHPAVKARLAPESPASETGKKTPASDKSRGSLFGLPLVNGSAPAN